MLSALLLLHQQEELSAEPFDWLRTPKRRERKGNGRVGWRRGVIAWREKAPTGDAPGWDSVSGGQTHRSEVSGGRATLLPTIIRPNCGLRRALECRVN